MMWRVWTWDWWTTQAHNIKLGVKNLIVWLPVIYLDRWWDHYYLYRILRFKLNQMEKNFRTRGMSVCSERDAKKMRTCVLLLDRLTNDDYITYNRGDNIRKSFEEEEAMINQDLDLLFKILRKNIRSWWD